ncbi:MAG: tetratricopeptide repeat protein [Cyanobacteria bacterium J06558_2]
MDEARLQAYIDLIEQLLTCSNKDAVKNMLQANQELIDWKFLQLMEKYADWLGEKQPGDNRAIYLRNIAQDIAVLNNSKGVNNKEYQVFLQEVLSAEIDSDSDPKAVYPILQRHQHLLDYNLAQLLEQYVIKFFSKWNRQKIAVVAQGIGNLCIDIQYFPLGIRVNNIEIAIIGYQVILESLYTREAFPEDWAATQNHLGIAYEDRIIGKRAENLELAITAYKQSLTVFTREANPEKWAETQMNLGNAYCQRIVGKRAENLELAITAYKQSLEVRTNEKNPENWANSQINLGNAYCDRIKGEKAGNLELAIAAYEKSLEVYTCKANPEQWATIQNNLGNAYWDRIKGEKAENLELAIAAHQKSLKIRTRNKNPEQWAETQNNLGIAYEARIRGENAENLELAITAYKQSLEVRTREANPEQWAITQNNLGSAYSRRIRGKRQKI